MGAGHAHGLFLDRRSVVRRLPPEVKVTSMVLFTVAMVLTPREAFWAFGAYALLVFVIALAAKVGPWWLLTRSLIELPFVVLALALPFLGSGATVRWLGLDLSVEGLYGGWNIIAKGTLGVLASLLLAATTPAHELIIGLDRLHTPRVFTQIATFMLRYLQVLTDEAKRMRIARISRGDDPRFLWQVRGLATGIGALFLRAYERGERVYLAMLSRGYAGRMPQSWQRDGAASLVQWIPAVAVASVSGAIAVASVLV